MSTKKFKTVAGYLRSMEENMEGRIPHGLSADERVARVKIGQRDIINQLLPQLALPKLEEDLTPLNGVKLLIEVGGTEQQMKALKAIERWLKNTIIVISSSVTALPTTNQ
jgi:hypothetical protein